MMSTGMLCLRLEQLRYVCRYAYGKIRSSKAASAMPTKNSRTSRDLFWPDDIPEQLLQTKAIEPSLCR